MKEANFLLGEGEEIITSQSTVSYKAAQVLAIFITAVAVVSLDCFFLGIGLTMALISDFKWLMACLFLVKLVVDVAVFAGWFFAVKEKFDRAKYTTFTVTDKRFISITDRDGETSFSWFDRKKTKVKIKRGVLKKFYGIYTVELSCGKYKSSYNFLKDSVEQIEPYFNCDK